MRLQLQALAYNLANVLRTLALPESVSHWSMPTLRDRMVKIGAKIVRHKSSITFQMAEVMVSRDLFQQILDAIAAFQHLLSPLRVGGVEIRNRAFSSAHGTGFAQSGAITDRHVEYRRALADPDGPLARHTARA